MQRSADHQLQSRIEALERRRDVLERELAAREAAQAALQRRYDDQVRQRRREGVLDIARRPADDEVDRLERHGRQTFRQGFLVGFVCSLGFGLFVLAVG